MAGPAPIRRKQATTQAEWLRALERADELVSWQRVVQVTSAAVAEIRGAARGKRAAFAWSGGKDSLVLEKVCEQAGIHECVLVISELEYPAFLRWATENMPDGLEVVNTGQDLAWLAARPNMLFPRDGNTAAKWFKAVQHTGQRQYFRANKLDVLFLGRRRSDGNYVGRPGGPPAYRDSAGVVRYSPIADWTHEEVLAFLKYHSVGLPPNYSWPRGFRVGTGPWPARQYTKGIMHGFSEVDAIDPAIVRGAAEVLPQAREYLARRGG